MLCLEAVALVRLREQADSTRMSQICRPQVDKTRIRALVSLFFRTCVLQLQVTPPNALLCLFEQI